MMMSAICDSTFGIWSEQCTKPMAFRKYVDQILCPGDKSKPEIKKKRETEVYGFLDWLLKHSHPSYKTVKDDFEKMRAKFTDPVTGKTTFTVFPAFFHLLKKLREMKISFIIILRTFGSDLPGVVKELETHAEGIKVTHWGKFKDTDLIVQEKLYSPEETYEFFLKSEEHFALQDDWVKWNKDGEHGRSGKVFLYDKSQCFRNVNNLALFFDDNITGEELDIVRPCEISGKHQTSTELFDKILFRVFTKDAILNDEYYVEKVFSILKNNK